EQPAADRLFDSLRAYFGLERLQFDALLDALDTAPPGLLVLDGLEVLQADGNDTHALGEPTDPLLRRLLRALVRGHGRWRVLVTTRLPLTDLQPWTDAGYHEVRLTPLANDDAVALLARWSLDTAQAEQ